MDRTHLATARAAVAAVAAALFLVLPAATWAEARLVSVSPSAGTLLDTDSVTLEGEVAAAVRLTIDGREVPLEEGRFRAGPYPVEDGERRFLLVLEGPEGGETSLVHRLTIDRRAPVLAVEGTPSLVKSSPVVIRGLVLDPHLESVRVAGEPVEVEGGRFAAVVALEPGTHRVEIVARDTLGHESRRTVALELDSTAPGVTLLAGGAPLTDGAVFRDAVVPSHRAEGAEQVELSLDGAPWRSGEAVTAEGEHRLEAVARDAAGNVARTAVAFTIDTTPPRLTLDRGGPVAAKTVAVSTFTVEGRVEGAVEVRVDGRLAELGDGVFRAGPFPLAAGERTFQVVARDAAGNETAGRLTVKNDPDAPVLTVSTPAEGAVVASSPVTVTGTAEDADLASVTVAGVAASLAGSAFTAEAALVEGPNVLAVAATDALGNASSVDRTVVLDTTPPVLAITAGGSPLAEGSVFAGLVTPEVSVSDATAVGLEATLDGAAWSPGTSITTLGSHELSVTATDAAGNAASSLVSFTLEGAPPSFAELRPADGSVLGAAEVTLTGRAEGAVSLTLDGATVPLVGADFVAGPYPLAEGSRTFVLQATSAGGQTTTTNLTLTRDSTAPGVAISSPPDGDVGTESTVTVTGTVADSHLDGVTVNGAAATVSGDPAAGATWSASVTLAEGGNRLRARAVDAAGNAASAERQVALDTRPPEVEILDPAAGTVVSDATVTVAGRAADPHLDRVEVEGVAAELTGESWSASVALEEGQTKVVAVAFDTLGHQGSATVVIARDPAAPAVAIDTPAEGTFTAAATVDVAGTVAEGATVTVNGSDAAVTGGGWSIAGVELAEGENRLVARATAADGTQGVHVRTVTRDTVAPSLAAVTPADGTAGLARDTSFDLTFSEPLAAPAASAWRLETAAGAPLPADAVVDGGELEATAWRIVSQGLLPPAADLRLILTAALEDRAGNPLPAATLAFTTVADGAPGAPVLDAVPASRLCAHTLTLNGTAAAGATVRVDGGAGGVEVRAAADGSFTLEVGLVPDRLHLLEVVAIDDEGRVSPSAVLEVAQDCRPPAVLSAELAGDDITVVFDEAVDPASVALTVSDASGDLAGSLAVAGPAATWTASASLPAGLVHLEVAAGVADLAGNLLEFPWVRLFGADPASSFLSGTVVDDSTGRPLAGARVAVTASDAVATADPRPEMTTGDDGRFLIPVAAGTHDLTVSRTGYSPVFRIATTVPGEGTEVFTPRLEPLGAEETVGVAGGRLEEPAGAALEVPAGALADDSAVVLARLGEQALPALLPYGWSPRGAAWVDLGTAASSAASTLELPVSSPPGTLVVVASLDLATLQWSALAEMPVVSTAAGPRVTVTLDPAGFGGLGSVAAVEPDTGPGAPPAAVVGEVLGSAPAPLVAEVLAATLTFDPEVVLPAQTAQVTVDYTLSTPQPSGLPLTLVIQEELELIDGTLRREAPYRAHLVLYHAADGSPRSHFRLRPSALARRQPLSLGAEDVTVLRYDDESVRGNVLGPEGGAVLGADGDRFEVPAGALSAPTPVVLERAAVSDLPLAAPGGGQVEAVLTVDLAGETLALPGQLSFATGAPPAGSHGLLLQVVEVEGAPAYRAVAELVASATGWETAPIDPADLAWPGVREGGTYVALRLDFEPAFARGVALDFDGLPLAGAVVSSPEVDWIQITGLDGSFVLPVPVGPVALELFDPATGNDTALAAEAAAGGERLDLQPQVEVVGPSVVETTPADGASVPAGINPQVRFSEPIDPASVGEGIRLSRAGQPVDVDLDVQGALVTVLPRATLAPGAPYTLSITGGLGVGVRDLQGYGLEIPVAVVFTVDEVALPADVDLEKVVLLAPSAGVAQVVGDPGAVPAGRLVWVENLTSYETTESVQAAQDGSFELAVGATLEDTLLFHVLVPGGNEVVKVLGPFLTADRQGAWVGTAGATFRTAGGVTVIAEEGTFDGLTVVRVEPRPLETPPIPWPAPGVLEPLASVELDFGGAEARKPLDLRIPAPAGAADDWYLLARSWDLLGEPLWSLKEIMVLDGDELTTERSAPPPANAALLGDPALKGSRVPSKGSTDPRDYAASLRAPGSYSVFQSGQPLFWGVVTVDVFTVTFVSTFPGMVIEATDALEHVSGAQDFAVPTLQGQGFELYARDARTGFELFREVFEPLEQPLVELAPNRNDQGHPFPLSGSPAKLQVVVATPGEQELGPGITAEVSEDRDSEGNLLPTQTLTVEFDTGSLVIERQVGPNGEEGPAIPLEVVLFSLADATETRHLVGAAVESSPVTVSRSVTVGDAYVLAVGAVLQLGDWLELEWNEALDEELDGFELELLSGGKVPVEAEPVGTYERVRLRPESGWLAGEAYTLRLLGDLRDAAGNKWLPVCDSAGAEPCDTSLRLRVDVKASKIFPGFDFKTVRDVERLGSLLFVAAGADGLWVLDASDPKDLTNYFGGDLFFGFPFGGQIRGLAIDPHGRVVVAGGGVSGPGQVKILDPLEFPDNPTTYGDLGVAWRGSSLVSNQLGADTVFAGMPAATPSHIEILSRDFADTWILGEDEVPEGLTLAPEEIPGLDSLTVTVSGQNGVEGQPVSLRNLTRGTWEREDAETGGAWSLEIEAQRGDRLQVLRNVDSLAYVLLDTTGIAIVDLNNFYGEFDDEDGDGVPDSPQRVQSQVLRYLTQVKLENGENDPLCNPNGLYLSAQTNFLVRDFAILGRGTNGPWFIPTLVHPYGLVMLGVDGNNPVELTPVSARCGVAGEAGAIGTMTGMGVAESFRARVIYDDDEVIKAPKDAQEVEIDGATKKVGRESRDYVFLGNSHGWVLVVDVTNHPDPRVVAKIELPEGLAGPMTFDREGERLLVSGFSNGLWMVDLGGPFPLAAIDPLEDEPPDADSDQEDDRVLEHVEVNDPNGEPLNVNRRVELWRDLGLVWLGGLQSTTTPGTLGLGGLAYQGPRVRFLAPSERGLQQVGQVAPFGVPTGEVRGAEEGTEHPGMIRVEMHLPPSLASQAGELRVDLVSVGPGGLEIAGAGDEEAIFRLPPTSYRDADGLLLERQSEMPWHEGYQIYLSEPIVMLADLRASHWYTLTQEEKDAEDSSEEPLCPRCDLFEEEVYPEGGVSPAKVYRELLSGHRLAIRLPTEVQSTLSDLYGPLLAAEAEAEVASVPWGLAPSLEQEPSQGPSYGHGEVAPGTLLHSGEYSHTVTDLELAGVGFDFAFTRTYRNQTVGAGPLGPGWDFNYGARLRPLPNGDVDFFDGRGRRVTFRWQEDWKLFDAPPGVFLKLTRDATGFWMKDRAGHIEQFDAHGRLRSILDNFKLDEGESTGSELLFRYDQASKLVEVSAHGRRFTFDYDDEGRLERLADDTGREVLYEYDGDGRLYQVKSPRTALAKGGAEQRLVTTYTYEAPGAGIERILNRRDNLASIEDARPRTWLRLVWKDGPGGQGHRLQSQTWGEDTLSLSFSDGAEGAETTVTDRRGKVHLYRHNDTGQVTYYKDPAESETTWKYGAYGDPEQGLLTEMVLPSGRKLIYEYAYQAGFGTDLGRVPPTLLPNVGKVAQLPGPGDPSLLGGACEPQDASTNGTGAEIAWLYEGHHARTHRPAKVTTPEGAVIFATLEKDGGFSTGGSQQVPTGPDGSESQTSESELQRDDRGRIEQQTHTRSDGVAVAMELDYGSAAGTAEDPLAPVPETVQIETEEGSYQLGTETDAQGRVTRVSEPGGVERRWEYNTIGWLLEECVNAEGTDVCTRYRYTKAGQVDEVEQPYDDGSQTTRTTFTYGLLGEVGEVTSEVMPGGAVVTERRTYDENLNVETLNATGRTTVVYSYDDRNLPITRSTWADAETQILEWFLHDEEGNLSSYTDGRGKAWRVQYDGYGRPMQILDPTFAGTLTSYDVAGRPRLTVACDAEGEALARTITIYDGADRLVREVHQDPSGQLPDATTDYKYDSASNLMQVADPLTHTVDYRYDGLQRLTLMAVNGGLVYRQTLDNFDERGNPQLLVETVPAVEDNLTSYSRFFEYDGYDRLTATIDGAARRFERAYDVRGNLVRETTPGGYVTEYAYDGLDRPTRVARPQGIEVTYQYADSADSSQVSFIDAKGQTTTYTYDGLGRLSSVAYADGTTETFVYDDAGNATEVTRPDGTVLTQVFDDLGQLESRTAVPAPGVGGHTTESFGYDALGRMTSADLQGVVSSFAYDGLARLQRDTTAGKSLVYQLDAAGQPTRLTYPSSFAVQQWWDALGQLDQTNDATAGEGLLAQYGWQGSLRGSKWVGTESGGTSTEILSGSWQRGLDRLSRGSSFAGSSGAKLLHEELWREGRGLLRGQTYHDRGGVGWQRTYDAAGRLAAQTASGFDDQGDPLAASQMRTSLASSFAFQLDNVDNLLEKQRTLVCEEETTALPLDGSGRNRPGTVDGVELAWDANGNLVRKGDLQLVYDFRGRLVEVKREVSPGSFATVATYGYDALDRRITRTVGGQTWRTVWDGWQAVEEYLDQGGSETLMSRRIYGAGLDEIVSLSQRLTPGAPELTDYVPLYDAVGNLVVLADGQGNPVERYEYSPHGERFIWADATPPAVEQVLLVDGQLIVELSEEVLPDRLESALNADLKLVNVTKGLDVAMAVEWPVQEGRNARERLVFTLEEPAQPEDREEGDAFHLLVPAAALVDFFDNSPASSPTIPPFEWQATGTQLVLDTVDPRLLHACVAGGKLRLELSETPDLAAAASEILLDGAPLTWTLLADGYTLESEAPAGQLTIGAGPFDLDGKPLIFAQPFDLDGTDSHLWAAALPGEVGMTPGERARRSTVGNSYGWKGLPVDPETGFVYVRNRYYDPDLGRFLTTDPFGYADGPNLYQFALNDPINLSDPTGEYVESPAELLSIGAGLGSLYYNSKNGNWGWVAVDLVGLGFDTAALFVPGVPGVAGLGLKAARAVDVGTDVTRAAVNIRRGQLAVQAIDVGQGLYEGGQAFSQGETGWGLFYTGLATIGGDGLLRGSGLRFVTRGAGSNFGNLGGPGRRIPGTPGHVAGGDSTELGKNIFENLGLRRTTSRTPYQAHHLLPIQLRNHPILRKLGIDLDDPSNGILLRIPDDGISPMARHQGPHPGYTAAIRARLDALDIDQSVGSLDAEVFRLQSTLRELLEGGLPVRMKDGGTLDLWNRWLSKKGL